MSGLLLVAALAAQSASSAATTPATTAASGNQAITPGESTYVDLEGGLGYSTNPVFSIGSSTGSGFGRVSAHVVHTRVSARTTTMLSGFAQSIFYTSRYGAEQSFDLNARHDAAVNEKLRVFIDGEAAYDRGGQLDTRILGVPNVPLLPGTTVPPPLLSGGSDFLTVTGKSYRFGAHTGGQLALGPRDFLDISFGADHVTFKNGAGSTRYTTIPASIGYDRQISERTTLGARVAADFTHYSATRIAPATDFHVITPEVTGQFRLSQALSLSADAGVSFAKVDDGVRTRNSTGFAGDVSLCSSGERTQLCARASVQEQAATSAGPARVISAGVDYSRRLSSDDTIQFSLSADRYANPTVIVSGLSFNHSTYFRAAADYSRNIGHRLFAGVQLSARKVAETGPDPNSDVSASIFIRYRLGDLQ